MTALSFSSPEYENGGTEVLLDEIDSLDDHRVGFSVNLLDFTHNAFIAASPDLDSVPLDNFPVVEGHLGLLIGSHPVRKAESEP